MGKIFSQLFKCLIGKKEMSLLMVGLDAVGKTTILHKLKLKKPVTTIQIQGQYQTNSEIKSKVFIKLNTPPPPTKNIRYFRVYTSMGVSKWNQPNLTNNFEKKITPLLIGKFRLQFRLMYGIIESYNFPCTSFDLFFFLKMFLIR